MEIKYQEINILTKKRLRSYCDLSSHGHRIVQKWTFLPGIFFVVWLKTLNFKELL